MAFLPVVSKSLRILLQEPYAAFLRFAHRFAIAALILSLVAALIGLRLRIPRDPSRSIGPGQQVPGCGEALNL